MIDTLLDSKRSYKPFKYGWAYEAWETQQKIHWLPEEVPMADDMLDFKRKCSAGEVAFLTHIFKFFTQADIEVNNCYMRKYAQVFQPVEIQMMLSAFSNMETIHVSAYSHLVDTLGLGDGDFYEGFKNYKEMKDKHDYMARFDVDSKEGIAMTLAVFGAFTEGLQLFASFVMLLNFQRFNKMKGMGQIISWSIRDETLHCHSIIKLFKTFIDENPEIWTEKLRHDLYDACGAIVHFEDAFIDSAFDLSNNELEELTKDDVKRYIRYIADIRLMQLGLKPKYLIKENPLPWVDSIVSGVDHTNFFENRVTEYSKSATQGVWDDSIYE